MFKTQLRVRVGGLKVPRKAFLAVLIAAAISLVAGCMPQSSPPQTVYYYTLEYQLPKADYASILPVVLRVDRFSVSPPFNSQQIIYADKGLHRNTYASHQWIASPGELLPYLIARDLSQTNGFQGVFTPDNAMVVTHVLSGWIEEFLEKDTADKWYAVLKLHITLMRTREPNPSLRIVSQQTYSAQTPCKEKTPAAVAEAMSLATAEISARIIRDVYTELSKTQ